MHYYSNSTTGADTGTFLLPTVAYSKREQESRRTAGESDCLSVEEQLRLDTFEYIGHELRSPLTSIMCTLSLLAEGTIGDLDESARSTVQRACRSSKRLLSLLNEMLETNRKPVEQILKYSQSDICEVLEVAASEVASLAAAKGQSILISSPEIKLNIDADRIGQVVINFLSNAIKNSPKGAQIRLCARQIEDSVEVYVVDQGNGIPAEFMARLFSKYEQANPSPGSSGLGLVISKSIICAHGGTIGAENLRGAGAKFWFRVGIKPQSGKSNMCRLVGAS